MERSGCLCGGKKPSDDPEKWGINKMRAEAAARKAAEGGTSAPSEQPKPIVNDKGDAAPDVVTTVGESVGAAVAAAGAILTGSTTDKSAAVTDKPAAVTDKSAAVTAGKAGLSSQVVKRIKAMEKDAANEIKSTEKKATQGIAAIFKKAKKPVPSTKGAFSDANYKEKATSAGLPASSVQKIEEIEQDAKAQITATQNALTTAIGDIHKKESAKEIVSPPSAPSTTPSTLAVASVAVAATGLSAAAAASVADIEVATTKKIFDVDQKAADEIAAIYTAEGATMAPRSATIGAATVGAAGAAVVAGLSADAVKKVAAIESKAETEVAAIDNAAVKELASVYKKDGTEMPASKGFVGARAATVSAVGAAAVAGLGAATIQKIAAIESKVQEQDAATDESAVTKVAAVYKAAGVEMKTSEGLFSSSRRITTTATAAAAAAGLATLDVKKIADIEEEATNDINNRDAEATKEISALYQEDGSDVKKSAWTGFAAQRIAAYGTMGTAAAAASEALAAKRGLGGEEKTYVERDENDPDEGNILSDLLYGIHMAIYDVGASVAATGNAVTGGDFEGPEEYDERYSGPRGAIKTPMCC